MQMLKDQAYDSLMTMIRNGQIRHGETYSINAVASEMNMSRTPVRDAIQKMCDEGRVDMLPSRGFRLHHLGNEELVGHYHFSNAIEGYCVISLAKSYKKGQNKKYVEEMQYLVEELGKRLGDDTPFEEYFQFDKRFHLVILESLEDDYFSSLQHSTMGFYDHPELQTDRNVSRENVYVCHKKILDCIIRGDAFGAYDALVEHSDIMMPQKP